MAVAAESDLPPHGLAAATADEFLFDVVQDERQLLIRVAGVAALDPGLEELVLGAAAGTSIHHAEVTYAAADIEAQQHDDRDNHDETDEIDQLTPSTWSYG
jgi:hypothetical protein